VSADVPDCFSESEEAGIIKPYDTISLKLYGIVFRIFSFLRLPALKLVIVMSRIRMVNVFSLPNFLLHTITILRPVKGNGTV